MNKLSDLIASGARSFLKTEYYYLSWFVAVFFLFLVILYSVDPPTDANDRLDGIRMGGCFLAGASLSALAGWGGSKLIAAFHHFVAFIISQTNR